MAPDTGGQMSKFSASAGRCCARSRPAARHRAGSDERGDGTPEAAVHGAPVARSVCPYCAVGCGQLVYHHGKLVSIEGDPRRRSPPATCARRAQPVTSCSRTPSRLDAQVKYRRPIGTAWQDLDLETAMDMIADRVWDTRERTFVEERRRQAADADHGDRAPRRRDARQRRELPDQEAVRRRPGHGVHQQPGPDMT